MSRVSKILFLSPVSLDRADDGVKIRGRSLLQALRKIAQVTTLCFGSGPTDVRLPPAPGGLERLFSPTPSLVRCFRSEEFADRVRREAKEHDVCFCLGLQMAQFCPALPAVMPVFLDNFNVESDILRRLANTRSGLKMLYWRLQAWKLRRFERWALRRATCAVAISSCDSQRFLEIAPGARVAVVAPGLDLQPYLSLQAQPRPGQIVFVGALDWHVNIDAAWWMSTQVLPHIQRVLPEASLAIVGRRPSDRVKELQSCSGVSLHADVPEVLPYLAEASLIVVPVRFGSGVQTKVIEAVAAGRPVVTTALGLEGLDLRPGLDLLVADGDLAFADRCLALLQDPGYADGVGHSGRLRVAQTYGLERLTDDVRGLMEEYVGLKL